MINLVLDDLRRPAGKGFDSGLELFILPLYLDGLIALALARATQQGQAPLFRFVRACPMMCVCLSSFTLPIIMPLARKRRLTFTPLRPIL